MTKAGGRGRTKGSRVYWDRFSRRPRRAPIIRMDASRRDHPPGFQAQHQVITGLQCRLTLIIRSFTTNFLSFVGEGGRSTRIPILLVNRPRRAEQPVRAGFSSISFNPSLCHFCSSLNTSVSSFVFSEVLCSIACHMPLTGGSLKVSPVLRAFAFHHPHCVCHILPT